MVQRTHLREVASHHREFNCDYKNLSGSRLLHVLIVRLIVKIAVDIEIKMHVDSFFLLGNSLPQYFILFYFILT